MDVSIIPYNFCNDIVPISSVTDIDIYGKKFFKFKNFFKKRFRRLKNVLTFKEVKITILTTYWALETFLFAVFLTLNPPFVTALLSAFLYIYTSYALCTAVNILIK